MSPDELMAVALSRLRPETAARAAAARALSDIELSNLVLDAEQVKVAQEYIQEIVDKRAELNQQEQMLDEYAKSLGVSV